MNVILLVPPQPGIVARPVSRGALQWFLARVVAAGYLLALCSGPLVADTRDLSESGSPSAPASAGSGDRILPRITLANPDDDVSDAISVCGHVVLAPTVTRLDVTYKASDACVLEPAAPRFRVFGARENVERGPPVLS